MDSYNCQASENHMDMNNLDLSANRSQISTTNSKRVSSEKLHAALLVGVVAIMATLLSQQPNDLMVFAAKSNSVDFQKNPAALVQRIKSLYLLTQTQLPNVAIVTEQEKIRSKSPFFAPVNNGDVIAYFPEEVFVYRPSRNILVKHGPVINNPTTPSETGVKTE